MTITTSTLYWITRLDRITATCSTITVLGALVLLFLSIGYYATDNSTKDTHGHKIIGGILKWFIPVWLFCLVGMLFIPTSKQMAMIYVVPHLAESQVVKQDIPEVYDLGAKALKDWLKKETKEETKGE